MADWPANGDTDWNTKMKANIDVGHDSDGTHKKSQMLTDMGWSPTTYTGEESVTYPNGFIVKMGTESVAANTTDDVTYAVAFPGGIKSVSASFRSNEATLAEPAMANPKSGSTMSVLEVTNAGGTTRNIDWVARGW